MTTTTGACTCGQIHFTIEGPAGLAVNCHCSDCRKRNGSAFSSYLVVDEDKLQLHGEQAPARFEIARQGSRSFCADCGTPLFNRNHKYPGKLMVFLGILDGSVPSPRFNLYTDEALDWVMALARLKGVTQGLVP